MRKIGVVGCGLMGAGIAEVCARADLDVIVVEASAEAARAGLSRVRDSLRKAESRGKIADADAVLTRIRITDDLGELSGRELVIEAIIEDESAKIGLLNRLDATLESPEAIIATNTSSIPVMKLAVATSRPESVIGIHFFNPVPVLGLVELIPSLVTASSTTENARRFVVDVLGKTAIDCQDRAGFVVNALLIPFVLSAIRMLESGSATADDIDQGLVLGAAHPQGPLALADLIGLDTTQAVAASLYEEFKEPFYAPPPLLNRMVEARLLGRKTGRGFFTYT